MLSIKTENGIAVMFYDGVISSENVKSSIVKEVIEKVVENGVTQIVFDATHQHQFESGDMSLYASIGTVCKNLDGKFVIASSSGQLKKLIENSPFVRTLNVKDTVSDAKAFLLEK